MDVAAMVASDALWAHVLGGARNNDTADHEEIVLMAKLAREAIEVGAVWHFYDPDLCAQGEERCGGDGDVGGT